MKRTNDTSRRLTPRVVAGGLAAAVVLVCGLGMMPWPRLSADITGDAVLAERIQPLLKNPANQVAVAYIDGGSVRYAGFGADEHTEFEIGSVSKTFTASLLADAVARGEVTLETTVADILGDELKDPHAEIGTVTLAELASHRSGLPRLALGSGAWKPLLAGQFLHRDPYTASPAEVLEQAQDTALHDRGTIAYSNLGYAFLGQLLAQATGQSWERLLEDRLITPLQLSATHAPVTAANLPDGAPTGRSASGLREGAWTANGTAPAGGIRSTAADLAAYAQAQLDGTAPGTASLDPQWKDDDSTSYGLAWVTSSGSGEDAGVSGGDSSAGPDITWHNGQTGGFWSMVALDRAGGRAVVLLSNVSSGQEDAALELLRGGL